MSDRRPPQLRIEPITDPGTPPRMVRCVYAWSPAWYTIHWGDTTKKPSKPTIMEEHQYPEPGTYQIAIVLDGDTKPTATGFIRVRRDMLPMVSIVPGDDPRYSDLIYIQSDEPWDDGTGTLAYYDISWGDGKQDQWVLAKPDTKAIWHGYNALGDYDVRITDKSTKRTRILKHTVEAPKFDPDFDLEYDPDDPSLMTAKLTVTKVRDAGEGEVRLSWGDGTDPSVVPNTVGHTETHTYDTADWYMVDLWYPGGGNEHYTSKTFAAGGEER